MRASSTKKIMMVNRISQESHTHQQHSSIQMSYQSVTSLSMIFNLTTYIYENISNCHTCYKKDRPFSAISNFKLTFVYIIPVLILLIIFIVVSVILSILYCKSKTTSRTNFSDPMYHKNKNEEFKREIMSTNTTNETNMNCGPYEVIIIESDDLESIACKRVVTNHQQLNDSSLADLISDGNVDSDGYQCPDSFKISASSSHVLGGFPFVKSLLSTVEQPG